MYEDAMKKNKSSSFTLTVFLVFGAQMDDERRREAILRDAGFGTWNPIPGRDYSTAPFTPLPRTRVESLVAERPIGRIEVVVLRRYPRRYVDSINWKGYVAAACGRDETGLVGLVLWGKQIDDVSVGDIVRIESGWCRRQGGEMVVSSGRNGQLTVIEG
ncbi:MAG: hypothetical protein QF707_05420 [Candidatus Poseidoniaceae archaeon]|nr:hypothetical protein [Candidatus Poseidoniaceae archaeon]